MYHLNDWGETAPEERAAYPQGCGGLEQSTPVC
jgi:hypothetical protein